MFSLSWFFFVSISNCKHLIKDIHTKINPNPNLIKILSKDIFFLIERYYTIGTLVHVPIMVHFLDRSNPIYPLKHDVHYHWLLWWHISAITCQIIVSICQLSMLTCRLFMSTYQIIMSTCQKNIITHTCQMYHL